MPSSFSFITGSSPTGIAAVAAASASTALRVLQNVLEIRSRKHKAAVISELFEAAAREAENLARLAEEDGQVYGAYVQARRERSPNVQANLRHAIEIPLAAARSARAGIDLCREALPFTQGTIAADVAGTAIVLAGAVRAILCCVETNLGAVEDAEFKRSIDTERRSLEQRAISESQSVLEMAHRYPPPTNA